MSARTLVYVRKQRYTTENKEGGGERETENGGEGVPLLSLGTAIGDDKPLLGAGPTPLQWNGYKTREAELNMLTRWIIAIGVSLFLSLCLFLHLSFSILSFSLRTNGLYRKQSQ